jgi:hypothetical protein
MHEKYSNKSLMIPDNIFQSIQLFRQRLNEINEVFLFFLNYEQSIL